MTDPEQDPRCIVNGWEIPTETYADQPYIVRTDDGAWLCAVTTGAGAGAQNAIGTGVLGGMVTATVLVIVFAPLFFVMVEKFFGKRRRLGPAAGRAGARRQSCRPVRR